MSIYSIIAIGVLVVLFLGLQFARTPSLFLFDLLDRIFFSIPGGRE